jgi:hypothetical protein
MKNDNIYKLKEEGLVHHSDCGWLTDEVQDFSNGQTVKRNIFKTIGHGKACHQVLR